MLVNNTYKKIVADWDFQRGLFIALIMAEIEMSLEHEVRNPQKLEELATDIYNKTINSKNDYGFWEEEVVELMYQARENEGLFTPNGEPVQYLGLKLYSNSFYTSSNVFMEIGDIDRFEIWSSDEGDAHIVMAKYVDNGYEPVCQSTDMTAISSVKYTLDEHFAGKFAGGEFDF